MHPSKEERPVSEKIIVLVSDRGDSKHGEVSVLDDPEKAERLLATLLGGGLGAGGVPVFSGGGGGGGGGQPPARGGGGGGGEGAGAGRGESRTPGGSRRRDERGRGGGRRRGDGGASQVLVPVPQCLAFSGLQPPDELLHDPRYLIAVPVGPRLHVCLRVLGHPVGDAEAEVGGDKE